MNEPLSDQGQHRREEIRLLAIGEARRRRSRKRIGRAAATIAIFAAISIFIRQSMHRETAPHRQAPSLARVTPTPQPPTKPTIVIEYIQTDPTITDRLTIHPEPPRWTSIGNTELLKELADAGQPAGIVCMNGKTILLPR